jgi:hypothetical protein
VRLVHLSLADNPITTPALEALAASPTLGRLAWVDASQTPDDPATRPVLDRAGSIVRTEVPDGQRALGAKFHWVGAVEKPAAAFDPW